MDGIKELEESVLELFETVMQKKFSFLLISSFYKGLDKFLIQSEKKTCLKIYQFIDCEYNYFEAEFFGLQLRKNGREKYHVDLYVKKRFSNSDTEIMRIPNFSQEKTSLTEILGLLDCIFTKKTYERNVNMKVVVK
jgi:hypothetical protein